MEKISIDSTDLRISPLCFGTMTFGDGADETTCAAMYSAARDAGLNFFDCANVYADGESERILGRLVRGHRDEVVITTKAYYPMHSDPGTQGLDRDKLITSLHASLQRLGMEFVDLFYLHAFDVDTPLEQSLATLDQFVRAGKVRYIGVSNFAAWQIMKALMISAIDGFPRIAGIQPMYNLLKRQCESEILPMAEAERLAVFPYGPVAGGYLTGKYNTGRASEGRLVSNEQYQKRYADDVNRQIAARFVEIARQQRTEPATLALAWVVSHPVVTAPIFGARTLSHLQTALAALEFPMTAELRNSISALSPAPALATDRSEERQE